MCPAEKRRRKFSQNRIGKLLWYIPSRSNFFPSRSNFFQSARNLPVYGFAYVLLECQTSREPNASVRTKEIAKFDMHIIRLALCVFFVVAPASVPIAPHTPVAILLVWLPFL